MKTDNLQKLLKEIELFLPRNFYRQICSPQELLETPEQDCYSTVTCAQWAVINDLYYKVKADLEENQIG